VLLSIAPEIAYYFRRRKLLPKQELVRGLESGGLIVSSQISHVDQILPLVQFWLPRIRVVEPAWLRERLETVLRDYLEQK
jgi:predicted DNA-binding transcriptional regulator YafY